MLSRISGHAFVKREKRKDAISEENNKLAYHFWASPGNSRPTSNKKDLACERIGPNEYTEQEKQILKKTKTEIYNEFYIKYPDDKMCQRSFESCKPFFVVPHQAS